MNEKGPSQIRWVWVRETRDCDRGPTNEKEALFMNSV